MGDPMVRIRRSPALEVAELHRRMERLMQGLLRGVETPAATHGWVPRVDIYETAGGTLVTLEIPGVKREEIEIVIEGIYMDVSGVRPEPAPSGCVRWHQMEIAYGRFERVIALPEEVDPESIRATYGDGFLRIEIPRRTSGARTVPIDER